MTFCCQESLLISKSRLDVWSVRNNGAGTWCYETVTYFDSSMGEWMSWHKNEFYCCYCCRDSLMLQVQSLIVAYIYLFYYCNAVGWFNTDPYQTNHIILWLMPLKICNVKSMNSMSYCLSDYTNARIHSTPTFFSSSHTFLLLILLSAFQLYVVIVIKFQ